MTRTITTAAELDALPVGSVILDNCGDAGLIDERDGVRVIQYAETDVLDVPWCSRYLPMTVLHDPSVQASVERGLAQSAAGETEDLGDFTQYLAPVVSDAALIAAHDREVQAEALRDAAETYERESGTSNGTIPWLRARADRIEKGDTL